MDNLFERLAAEGKLIAYFGYGSLVNPFTHRTEIVTYAKARIRGWQRRWKSRPYLEWDPTAFLSSHPIEGPDAHTTWLDGLMVFDHVDNLPSLDLREAGYYRRSLSADDYECVRAVPEGCPVYVYEGMASVKPDTQCTILHSYLDAVLQGYHIIYGPEAIVKFVETTSEFETPILMDRKRPRYPRAVSLDPVEKVLIDKATAHLNFVEEGMIEHLRAEAHQ